MLNGGFCSGCISGGDYGQMGKKFIEVETGEVKYQKAERFIKTMEEVWRYLNKKDIFTTAEEKTLHRLSMFLQINTNAIVSPNGEYMSIEKMAEETGIDRSHIRKVVNLLMTKNALGMWKSGNYEIYYMNPFLYQKGFVKPYLFGMFDERVHERNRKADRKDKWKQVKTGKKVTSIIIENPKVEPKKEPKAV
jgi:hypothetical protein